MRHGPQRALQRDEVAPVGAAVHVPAGETLDILYFFEVLLETEPEFSVVDQIVDAVESPVYFFGPQQGPFDPVAQQPPAHRSPRPVSTQRSEPRRSWDLSVLSNSRLRRVAWSSTMYDAGWSTWSGE